MTRWTDGSEGKVGATPLDRLDCRQSCPRCVQRRRPGIARHIRVRVEGSPTVGRNLFHLPEVALLVNREKFVTSRCASLDLNDLDAARPRTFDRGGDPLRTFGMAPRSNVVEARWMRNKCYPHAPHGRTLIR
mgnify:CR=1 FL=1